MQYLTKGLQDQIVLGTHPNSPFRSLLNLSPTLYNVPLNELFKHSYIVGATGTGKSSFISSLHLQYTHLGIGNCLIDPHGDMTNYVLKILAYQPINEFGHSWLSLPENQNRLIYIEPGRSDYYTPMNVFNLSERPIDIASQCVEAFQTAWFEELQIAPAFKNYTKHAILPLIEHGLTLVELPLLFENEQFRKVLETSTQNKYVSSFFANRFSKWGAKEQSLRLDSLLNKVTDMVLDEHIRVMIGDTDNFLNFRHFMDEGKIVLINLASCRNRDIKNYLISLFFVALKYAASSRINIDEQEREPWLCTFDEIERAISSPGMAGQIIEILDEMRKFKLFLGMAHHGTYQLSPNLESAIFSQTGWKFAFKTDSKTSLSLADELADPDLHKIRNPAPHEKAHPQYESWSDQVLSFATNIKKLKKREMLVQVPDTDTPISLRTIDIPQITVKRHYLEQLKVNLLKRPHNGKSVQAGLQQMQERRETLLQKEPRLQRRPTVGRVVQNPSISRV